MCLYLTALVPNGQLVEAKKKDKVGTYSVVLSAGDHSHHCRVALVPYAVPARLHKAGPHVFLWSLSSLYLVSSSVMPSSEPQA